MDRILDEKVIPYGEYCYEIKSVENSSNGTLIKTLRCPYFIFKVVDDGLDWREAHCTFLDETHYALDSQEKICNKNMTKPSDIKPPV